MAGLRRFSVRVLSVSSESLRFDGGRLAGRTLRWRSESILCVRPMDAEGGTVVDAETASYRACMKNDSTPNKRLFSA